MIKRMTWWLARHEQPDAEPSGDFVSELGAQSFAAWLKACHADRRLHTEPSADDIRHLMQHADFKTLRETLSTQANRVLRHEFDLLGSGPFTPVDPERPATDGYQPIDWYLDPVRNLRFPRGIPHKEWSLYVMRPENADIKYPWELARCQHWVLLGQACLLFRDPRYAREIILQLDDFMAANPVGVGVNWTCTMDVAIRAANWAVALQLLRHCDDLSQEDWQRAYKALFAHGTFIYDNLENHYEVTSNHYLSNVVGLYFISETFADLPSGRRWITFCRTSLETEMSAQVLDDGADFESSVPYHRLVTELFLGAARLARHRGQPLTKAYESRLALMLEYHIAMLRPDGCMAVIGDADDGRLHIFTDYGLWNRQDGRHLIAPGAATLERNDWLRFAGPAEVAQWELSWWGFSAVTPIGQDALPDGARLFPQAGHAIYRQGGSYLAVTNAIVGTKGFGNHKHNDQLGFELHMQGRPLLVDAGSYVYTSDFDARNLFRGTGYHNTLMVDETEQNETRSDWIFRLFDSGKPEHLRFEHKDGATYLGRHVGYRRLKDPLDHTRVLRLLPGGSALFILDRVESRGPHRLRWHFHAAPGLRVAAVNGAAIWLTDGTQLYAIISLDGLAGVDSAAWVSPSYGVRQACTAVDFSESLIMDGALERQFLIASATWLGREDSGDMISQQVRELSRFVAA
jgi:hypothetical protein